MSKRAVTLDEQNVALEEQPIDQSVRHWCWPRAVDLTLRVC